MFHKKLILKIKIILYHNFSNGHGVETKVLKRFTIILKDFQNFNLESVKMNRESMRGYDYVI